MKKNKKDEKEFGIGEDETVPPPWEEPKKEAKKEAKKEESKESLTPCTVARDFSDGNIPFSDWGYEVQWTKGEKRKLPMWVIDRVRNSGGEIELLRE